MTPLPIKPLIDSTLGRVALLEQQPIPRPFFANWLGLPRWKKVMQEFITVYIETTAMER
jgi:hypothetical protein